MMLNFDADKVAANARQSATEDLLDRVTVYRGNMEPAAVDVIEAELRQRGVSAADVAAHAERRQADFVNAELGDVFSCSLCRQPAVAVRWRWHWWWGVVPLFPRRLRLCREHLGSGDPSEPVT